MLSLLAISILAVPAASEEIVINDKQEEGIVKKITTDLGDTFSFSSSDSKRKLEISDHKSKTVSVSTPGSKEITVESPEGKLTEYTSANTTYTKVETPYGVLKTGYQNGQRFEEFNGVNRSRVEKVKTALLDLMKEKKKVLNRRKAEIVENNTADVRIEQDPNTTTLNITNMQKSRVSMGGWKIHSKKSKEAYRGYHTFESISLNAGEELVLGVDGTDTGYTDFTTSAIQLYDYGDKVTLVDSWGNNVTSIRYD